MVARPIQPPDRGDIVWLTMSPQRGREQSGRRPALCLSPKKYNQKVGLAIFCPITSKKKGYPFEVEIRSDAGIDGVVLADQIKSLDWRARKMETISRADPSLVDQVTRTASLLI